MMASFAEEGSLSTTTQLQTISDSTSASQTFKSLFEHPLVFEKATTQALNSSLGLNGRYTPLNKPFVMEHGKSSITNGFSTYRSASDGVKKEDGDELDQSENGILSEGKVKQRISTRWAHILPRPPGLKNYGNTCYMNSTLQALMHVPPLVQYLLSGAHGTKCDNSVRQCVMCRMERHARDSYPQSSVVRHSVIEPYGFVGKLGVIPKFYNVNKQEDAHELFLHLLDKMDEAEKKAYRNPKHVSILQEMFGGECRQTLTCGNQDCRHASHTTQPFSDLSLDLLSRDRDLTGSLDDFTREETLSQDNQYKCEKCKAESRAKKQTTIHTVPPILAIHLKRFSANGQRKNSMLLNYPEELDLNPYMSSESKGIPKYRLFATVCHFGLDFSGLASGHYTANCKSGSNVWYNFDDTHVSKTHLYEVLKDRDAYILFYARDDGGHGGSVNGTPNGRPTTPLQSPLSRGVSKMNGGTNASAKRPADDSDHYSPSPAKRPRTSDDEVAEGNSASSIKVVREPLKSVTKHEFRPSVLRPSNVTHGTQYRPSLNGFESKRFANEIPATQIRRPVQQPPKIISGAECRFFKEIEPKAPKQNGTHSKARSFETTTRNPYLDDNDNDPFVTGAMIAQQRKGLKFAGIVSAIVPGETKSFNNKVDGIKHKRKDSMRI